MKKYGIAISAILIVATLIFIGCSRSSQNAGNSALPSAGNTGSKTSTDFPSGVLTINDISADPFAYKGTITVTGVVAKTKEVQAPANGFLVIDTSEAETCKQTGCARFYLPVEYDGQKPTEWDVVNVTGTLSETGRSLSFTASKVEVQRHLSL